MSAKSVFRSWLSGSHSAAQCRASFRLSRFESIEVFSIAGGHSTFSLFGESSFLVAGTCTPMRSVTCVCNPEACLPGQEFVTVMSMPPIAVFAARTLARRFRRSTLRNSDLGPSSNS